MIRIFLSLFLFFSLPALWVALALKSWIALGVGVMLGMFGVMWVWVKAWAVILDELNPSVMPVQIRERLERLFGRFGPSRFKGEFLLYRSAEPEVKVWIRNRDTVTLLMSVAFLETATDEGMIRVFQDLNPERIQAIRVENRLFSIRLIFDRWKGRVDQFRYWFVSFWLFPIERMLKMTRI